jgi:hypothetical protein
MNPNLNKFLEKLKEYLDEDSPYPYAIDNYVSNDQSVSVYHYEIALSENDYDHMFSVRLQNNSNFCSISTHYTTFKPIEVDLNNYNLETIKKYLQESYQGQLVINTVEYERNQSNIEKQLNCVP